MRLFIHHRTDYRFSEPQTKLVQLLRLTPHSHAAQNVIDWRIDVSCNARLRPGRDGFGNLTSMLYVDGPIESISLTVNGEVLTEDRAGMVGGVIEPLPPSVFLQATRLTKADIAVAALADEIAQAGGSRLEQAHRLNSRVHESVRFDSGRRAGALAAAAALGEGHGVAQDLAHAFIGVARALGMPARYVAGHIFRHDRPDHLEEASHAWAETWIEDYGWIGFDPTTDRCPCDRYVRVAVGLDYRDAAPLSGARTGGGVEELEVGVRVGLSQGLG